MTICNKVLRILVGQVYFDVYFKFKTRPMFKLKKTQASGIMTPVWSLLNRSSLT